MSPSELAAVERGDFCEDHKVLLEEGRCEECILSKPAWKPGDVLTGGKHRKGNPLTIFKGPEGLNWTDGLLTLISIIALWGGFCWWMG